MSDLPGEYLLEPEEAALILLLRRHVDEIRDLSAQSDIERAEWEAANPGEPYSALSIEDSSGGKAYSQCAEACADMALAAFELAAKTLGITGWQGSWAELEFIRRSRHIKGPFGIYDVSDALYPQYDLPARLDKLLTGPDTVKWLGDEAERMLAENREPHPNVERHWRMLVAQRDAAMEKQS